jgi:amidase
VHAFGDDALGDLDATALAASIAAGERSAAEVVEAAIARAEKVGELDAIQVSDYDRARATARGSVPGVFSGVPFIVKDNVDVAGLPTNHGSEAFRGRVARADSPIAALLAGLGLVNLGKSRLPEFGLNASTEYMTQPPVRNPWHTDYSAGASSGGSAALVAAGVVPIAHANDGGGSIRIPAACCGLVGLKPTRGRIDSGPVSRIMPVDIISEGLVSRTVRDSARAYAGLERQYRAAALPPIGLVEGPAKRRLRVGVLFDSIAPVKTDDETRATVAATADLLAELGHDVFELDPAQLPITARFADDFGVYWGVLATALWAFGNRIYHVDLDRSKLDGLTRGLARHYRRHAWKTPAVLARLRATSRTYRRIAQTADVVLSPVLAHTTPRLGYLSPTLPFDVLFQRLNDYAAFTPYHNAAGAPALSLPLGTSANGLPIGVHLSGAHGDERTLLELGFELEEARPFRRIQDPPD